MINRVPDAEANCHLSTMKALKCESCNPSWKEKGGRLRVEDIAELLRKHYGVEYHPDAIYNLLQRIGMSWISGRSRHPKADIKKQEAFKKNL